MKRKRRKNYVPRDPKVTSAIMSRIPGKNTKPELILRRAIWRLGLRYRLHSSLLPGSPDIVFARSRVAVFVDGDYWHGRAYIEQGPRAFREVFRGATRSYWIAKIKRNVSRDRQTDAELKRLGWIVVRVWEKEVLYDLDKAVRQVSGAVRSRPVKK